MSDGYDSEAARGGDTPGVGVFVAIAFAGLLAMLGILSYVGITP